MKKPKFISNVSIGGGALSVSELRTAAMSDPKSFMGKVNALIESGKVTLSDLRDLKGVFHALADVQVPVNVDMMGQERAIMASAFPLLTGGLTVKGINDAYESVPTIGQEFVEDFEDNKKVTTMALVHAIGKNGPAGVKEGDPYPEVSASEEKVEIRNKRDGLKLSLTAEAIEENDIADFVQKVNKCGEIGAEVVEEQTLSRVCDQNGSASSAAEPYVYRPNGAGTALFSATANTPGPRAPNGTRKLNNALTDDTDLEALRQLLVSMLNQRGKRVNNWNNSEMILAVPDALVPVAQKILNSELIPGNENEHNPWGPKGSYRPRLVSSPKLDDISTTAWYMGRPKRQFKRKWKLRFEYVTLSGDTQAFLDRRIAAQFRIGWDVEIGAIDYIYWVQSLLSTAAASAPSAANNA